MSKTLFFLNSVDRLFCHPKDCLRVSRVTPVWLLFVTLLGGTADQFKGEAATFLSVKTNEILSFDIKTNELLYVHAYSYTFTSSRMEMGLRVQKSENSEPFFIQSRWMNSGRTIISGPLKITFPVGVQQIVAYDIITNTSIRTVALENYETVDIVLQEGKWLRYIGAFPNIISTNGAGFYGYNAPSISLLVQGESFPLLITEPGFTIPGPAVLSVRGRAGGAGLYTFAITGAPDSADPAIATQPASSVALEASADLINWRTVFTRPLTADTAEFIRLKLQR